MDVLQKHRLMNTLIDFLFYPYERPVSRISIRKVGIVLLLIGVAFNAAAIASLTIESAHILITLLLNSLVYLSFITLTAGMVMIKISASPAHRSPTLLYRMRLGIATFMIAGALLIYIVVFAGLPIRFVYISIAVFFALIISIAIINISLQRKYRRLEIEERKTGTKSQQVASDNAPDYIVPFKGIKTVKRRKILVLLLAISILLLYPFILVYVLQKDYPYLHDVAYCCIPVALLFSNTALYLNNKWRKEEKEADKQVS